MAIEIEKKYRLDEKRRAEILEILKEFGATNAGEQFEENTIYGGGVLDAQGSVLRVRRTDSKTLLTYKRRTADQTAYKKQIEYETEVKDADAVEKIIDALEFKKVLIYEKRRRTFHLKNAEIVLDELPFGEFMEIEGAVTAIKEIEMLLDIEDLPAEHETYPHLTARFGKKRDGVIIAAFE